MGARYKIRLKDTTGTLVAELDQFIRLIYKKQVNKSGYYALWMSGDDDRIDLFTLDTPIEIWRAIPEEGVDWYLDFEALHRTPVRQKVKTGAPLFTSYGRGYNDLLSRRHILYNPDSAFTQKSGAGETIMKEYVDENIGPSATFPPRLFASGVIPGFTVQADGAAGNTWSGGRAYKNLLTVCQEIANETGVDFQVVGTGDYLWEFRAFDEQLGIDSSILNLDITTGLNGAGNPPVIFSVVRGNMGIPIYSESRNDEVNTLMVLGKGQGTDRERVQVVNADVADSPINRREGVRNSTANSGAAELTSYGEATLPTLAKQESFVFNVIQVPSTLYGRDYNLGDLITARFDDIERNKKIVDVEVSVSAENTIVENVRIEVADLPTS